MISRQGFFPASERSSLDPFIIGSGDVTLRDQRDLMERPFFSLSKSRRIKPILYQAADVEVQVFALPEFGMATIWDADILIWAASQIVEARNQGLQTSRLVRFTPYQVLTMIGRARGATEYRLLKGAFRRLQSTVVATSIRQGEHWRRQQFSWLNEWEELVTRSGEVEGMEFVLPDWFYRGVVDQTLVLSIDPAYFQLTGGIERWLYRIARKHAGKQSGGWVFEFIHLHAKSGSLARISDFAQDLRGIVLRQSLPGYRLQYMRDGRRELLRILPSNRVSAPVESLVNQHVISGANRHVISGAEVTGYQAQKHQLSLWPETIIRHANLESNKESNSFLGKSPCGKLPGQGRQKP